MTLASVEEQIDSEEAVVVLLKEAFDAGKDPEVNVFDYWNSDPNWARFNESVPAEYTETDAEKLVAELISRDRESQPNWAVTLGGKVVPAHGST